MNHYEYALDAMQQSDIIGGWRDEPSKEDRHNQHMWLLTAQVHATLATIPVTESEPKPEPKPDIVTRSFNLTVLPGKLRLMAIDCFSNNVADPIEVADRWNGMTQSGKLPWYRCAWSMCRHIGVDSPPFPTPELVVEWEAEYGVRPSRWTFRKH